MTQAVTTLLIFFALLFILYVIAIVYLMLKQSKSKRGKSISPDSLLVVYATQSGQSEQIATQTAEQLSYANQVELVSTEHLSAEQLQAAKQVIWVVSTYGEGDAPDQAQHFDQHILKSALDLSQQQYAILALGDRRYANYCEFGYRLNQYLQQNQARPWFDLVTVDQMSQDDLSHWNNLLAQHFQQDLEISTQQREWQSIQLKSRRLLNEGSQGQPLYQVVFDCPNELQWQSGDILEIQCENSNQDLTDFHLLHSELNQIQLEQLRARNLRELPIRTYDQDLTQWLNRFKLLPLREYSIANICVEQQLALVVRQEQKVNELGLGSGLLTQGLKLGQSLSAHVRSNPSFQLLAGAQPAIFIGNGSGIAGLFGHIQHRIADAHYQNWLIYGERELAHDNIFAEELQNLKKLGKISELNRVFSRDDSTERYVQDILRIKAEILKLWIKQGAVIYLCGSLNMAQGVDEALHEILGADQLNDLRKSGRYRRDVY